MSSLEARQLFDGKRLRLARELAEYSQKVLAERTKQLGKKVSSAAISQFEKGDATPNPDTLEALGRALDTPVGYFAAAGPADAKAEAFFRSLTSTPAPQRKRAKALTHLVWQFTNALESYVQLPEPRIPRADLPEDAEVEEVERIAELVRREWNVAPGPIDSVVQLLERHGVVVVRFSFCREGEPDSLDAFSMPFDRRPIIALTEDKAKKDRSRFDAAHELGHLAMHEPEAGHKQQKERQAQQFAAAFLAPREDIKDELPTDLDWSKYVTLKRRWGMSIAALLRRSYTVGNIEHDVFDHGMRVLTARGWRKDEPGDLGPTEVPKLLVASINAAQKQAGKTMRQIVEAAELPYDALEAVLGSNLDSRPQVVI